MGLDALLAILGFERGSTLISKQFVHYHKGDAEHIFLFRDANDGSAKFSSPSGEWQGNIFDLITFYYGTDNSSAFNEADRIALFIRENGNASWEFADELGQLDPVDGFNLYRILFREYGNSGERALGNALERDGTLYFFLMDEDITPSRQYNILGVVSYDRKSGEETTVRFSDLERSVYFSDPSIDAAEAVIFGSFGEMVSFKTRMQTDFLYVVFKGRFNAMKAKTISLICETKGISKTYLAFPDRLEGYYRDIEYLGVFAGMGIKERTGFLKITVPQSVRSDMFIKRLKDLKSSVEKELDNNLIPNLISIKAGRDLENEPVFVVEIARIANVLKGFLVLASKFLLDDMDFRIVKPKGVFWAEDKAHIKNVGTEFKLNIYDTIGEVYHYN